MNMGAEPFFLKQHYKDVLAFLDRESAEGANICNVWVYNFEHELAKISKLLKKYTYVAMVSACSSWALSSFWHVFDQIQTCEFSGSMNYT